MLVTTRITNLLARLFKRDVNSRSNATARNTTYRNFDNESAESRLKRLTSYCTTGQIAAAQLELYEWHRQPDCPTAAIVLLASLFARQNRIDDAMAVLSKRSLENLDIATVHATLLIEAGMTESARQLTRKMFEQLGDDANTKALLTSLELPGADILPDISKTTAETLASELLTEIELIPSLVAAQKINPDQNTVLLIRRAINHLHRDVDNLDELLIICQAMADLAKLVDDHDDLRRWAHRGLKLNPYNAQLALALSQIDDDPAVGPPATAILRKVADNHNYPDIQAALIRRENSEGYTQSAQLRLKRWLNTEPENPTALKLKKEIAA